MKESVIRFYCDCKIERFDIPLENISDDDEIVCPFCGEEPHSYDIRTCDSYYESL